MCGPRAGPSSPSINGFKDLGAKYEDRATHELETNELADSMSHWIENVKPYGRTALGLLIALVVLFFAYTFVSRRSAARSGEAWTDISRPWRAAARPAKALGHRR